MHLLTTCFYIVLLTRCFAVPGSNLAQPCQRRYWVCPYQGIPHGQRSGGVLEKQPLPPLPQYSRL